MERDFKSIPEEHKKRLKFDYEERIRNIRDAVDRNYEFFFKIVSQYIIMFNFYLILFIIKTCNFKEKEFCLKFFS